MFLNGYNYRLKPEYAHLVPVDDWLYRRTHSKKNLTDVGIDIKEGEELHVDTGGNLVYIRETTGWKKIIFTRKCAKYFTATKLK